MGFACDVLVAGSGAGGLAAAVTAREAGLDVLVAEKEPWFGGTTALSGGWLWIPNHPMQKEIGVADSIEDASTYLLHEAGEKFDPERVNAFLTAGPRMIEFFTRETAVKFDPSATFSDYHPDAPGGRPGGRSIVARAFDGRELGRMLSMLRPPLPELTVFGIMIGSGAELVHFMRWSKSLASAAFVARRLLGHGAATLFHGRGVRLTNGNALAGRLLKSALDAGVRLEASTSVKELVREEGRVTGAILESGGSAVRVMARKGVVLACGGFPRDGARQARLFRHREHYSPAPPGNTGDGLKIAEAAGALLDESLPNAAAWVPVSRVPRGGGAYGLFPHFIDRAKPGVLAVTRHGTRFVNEGNSYHDFVQALLTTGETHAWLVTDHRALRAYGLGFVKPRPLPIAPHLKSGYLLRGETVGELAVRAGIHVALEGTVEAYNAHAKMGSDPVFRKGENAYNRFYGDPDIEPNPCVAPLAQPPFYAVRVEIGDLGTYAGIATNGHAQVLDAHKRPIPGLYAAGNDALSIMGGNYPGPGITLGPAMTFGWIAGRHLAGQLP
ncbi:MAG: FAD-dependent oxidoreductase [Betaproteobacteria bacterium]|nr:FAD-dependent oxidoreductase [Betaproteobacteria bacterium]MDH5220233.1 FAD-dependent oxidoreductase [Betaproteobacteria bacterium]MDH5349898.1 FAD-dependent oxidoreductase [Betaproteobacteria bacterium]